ncbi:LytR/AlgR family response regulator transcription factor [Zongyangia hominis]|uniref:LytTR family transcriptional regulator n=1 Tax=Zongyangia hominis TaxID=2763677 RepID=A0A926EB88_9FIRM|nr:LytTR family DNA-binding domain-containing protein [Zongyangia hominis]MBC8570697.1 LytTR family transcriptional regulator [Zongyangia hominis]
MNIAIYDPSKEDGEVLESLIQGLMTQRGEEAEVGLFTEMDQLLKTMHTCEKVFDMAFLFTEGSAAEMRQAVEKVRDYNRAIAVALTGPQDLTNLELQEVPAAVFIKKPYVESAVDRVLEMALGEYSPERSRHILVHTARQDFDLLLDNLLYASSNRRIVTLCTRQGFTFSCYCKLSELEAQISDRRFLRCHQSFLVNMDYINNIIGHSFIMEGGDSVKIRQSGISKIKERYYAWALGRY